MAPAYWQPVYYTMEQWHARLTRIYLRPPCGHIIPISSHILQYVTATAQSIPGRVLQLLVGPPPRPGACCLCPACRSDFARFLRTPRGIQAIICLLNGRQPPGPRSSRGHAPEESITGNRRVCVVPLSAILLDHLLFTRYRRGLGDVFRIAFSLLLRLVFDLQNSTFYVVLECKTMLDPMWYAARAEPAGSVFCGCDVALLRYG